MSSVVVAAPELGSSSVMPSEGEGASLFGGWLSRCHLQGLSTAGVTFSAVYLVQKATGRNYRRQVPAPVLLGSSLFFAVAGGVLVVDSCRKSAAKTERMARETRERMARAGAAHATGADAKA